jgi:uncharacterized protein YbjT (DUF2867 family)
LEIVVASPILITGGTGTLGSLITPRLRATGVPLRVLSRSSHAWMDGVEFAVGDLTTGAGVEAAANGVETIVHCAGTAKGDAIKARNLVQAAARAGRPHLVFISVVGAERVPVVSGADRAMFGYFESKRAAERVVEESGLPWTTLRATQFYDSLVKLMRAMAKSPVIPASAGVRFQPVDAGEVADRMVQLSLGDPAGLVDDMAGPKVYGMAELIRIYLRANHRRRLVLTVPMVGKAYKAVRAGANLPLMPRTGKRTWEEYVAAHARRN